MPKISNMEAFRLPKRAGRSPPLVASRSAVDQRAAAILRIAESVLGRNGGLELVEVARVLRFGRRLDLEEVCVMPLASGRVDGALAEQRIVSRRCFHLCDDRLAVGIATQFQTRLEIVQDAR